MLEAAVPPPSMRCQSLKPVKRSADELREEEEDASIADGTCSLLVPTPSDLWTPSGTPCAPLPLAPTLSTSSGRSSGRPLLSTADTYKTVETAAELRDLQGSALTNARGPSNRDSDVKVAVACGSAARATASPTLSPPQAGDGGEAATTAKDLDEHYYAITTELRRRQRELRATLESTERAKEEQARVTQEISDMERYRSTLDGIIAFTLRELEDAAAGVEEAEKRLAKEASAVWRRLEEMQASHRSNAVS
ncbi:hypothetical protein LSCM1_01501 [Leishmania martiniquensis]|uniref:Uncharacterized protein n=1 Tax=Leishmania martiniquensis TaxID=1580590 RepID=A0A836H6Q1_9TRYP|nr:hypothetical protein LSCM1_01501 [Leishmania martiniquensis]